MKASPPTPAPAPARAARNGRILTGKNGSEAGSTSVGPLHPPGTEVEVGDRSSRLQASRSAPGLQATQPHPKGSPPPAGWGSMLVGASPAARIGQGQGGGLAAQGSFPWLWGCCGAVRGLTPSAKSPHLWNSSPQGRPNTAFRRQLLPERTGSGFKATKVSPPTGPDTEPEQVEVCEPSWDPALATARVSATW